MAQIKVWDGSQWVKPKAIYEWTGSQWVKRAGKYWNGNEWVVFIQYADVGSLIVTEDYDIKELDPIDGSVIRTIANTDYYTNLLSVDKDCYIYLSSNNSTHTYARYNKDGNLIYDKSAGTFSYCSMAGRDGYFYVGLAAIGTHARKVDPNGNTVWTVALDNHARGYDVDDKGNSYVLTYNFTLYKIDTNGNETLIDTDVARYPVTYCPVNDAIYTVGWNGVIHKYDASTGNKIMSQNTTIDGCYCASMDASGNLYADSGNDATFRKFNSDLSEQWLVTLNSYSDRNAVSPDGNVYLKDNDGSIIALRQSDGSEIYYKTANVKGIAITPGRTGAFLEFWS